PTTAEWFLGVGNFHGEIVPVIDIKAFQQKDRSLEPRKFIVLRSLKRKNFDIAIPVDTVCGINSVDFEITGRAQEDSFLIAESVYNQKCLYLVDVERLIKEILNRVK
ncbi:MAG: chemotaxis protein CheW, partial [Pyrinomonadaceae bacterium]